MRMEEKEKNRKYLHAFWLEQMVDGDLDSILKSRHYFVNKGFSSSHVWM